MRYYDEETVKKLLVGEGPRELKFCPSVEIPKGCGRLIDADKLHIVIEHIIAIVNSSEYDEETSIVRDCLVTAYSVCLSKIEDAPTIVEVNEKVEYRRVKNENKKAF